MHRFIVIAALVIAACEPADSGRDPKEPPTDPTRPTDTGTPSPTLPTVPAPVMSVTINEVMAANDSVWVGPEGDRPDWVELVNNGETDAAMNRVRLVDASGNEWRGTGTLAAGERLMLTGADLGFELNKEEDSLSLFIDGAEIEVVEWLALERDVSIARTPDLTGDWVRTAWPTPAAPNEPTASTTLDAADAHIFVKDRVHRIDFTLTPEAYEILNSSSSFGNEPWAQAGLTIDDMSFDVIGLRLKGSASFDTMEGKPAFKVDMNRGVPGQRLRTLKGFNLHNGNVLDPTRARDHISYRLANEAGIMAPRVGWADVYINDNHYGIYMIIEQHDDVMIDRWFPGLGETGVMFEPNESRDGGWGGDFGSGSADNWDMEEGPLPPDPGIITALQTADDLVASASSDANVAELWNHVDKDNLLTYMAWESVVSHTDGYKAPNNWRVFVHPVDYKIHLVPAGAEWTWDFRPQPLSWGGRLAQWCLDNRGCRQDYGARAIEVAELVGTIGLQDDFAAVSTMLAPYLAADPRSPHGTAAVNNARTDTFNNIASHPGDVARDICADMPTTVGCN